MWVGQGSVLDLKLFIGLLTVFVLNTEAQLCTRIQISSETRNITYSNIGKITILLNNCTKPNSISCIGHKYGSRNVTKTISISKTEIITECCPGYVNNSDICEPICASGCQNGFCQKPEVCACNTGYKLDSNNLCTPHCSDGCDHGSCITPETCKCNEGWKMSETIKANNITNITCQPICKAPCINGSCVAPDTCECLRGYKESGVNMCTPHCADCEHGSCVSPDTCVCDIGWYKSNVSNSCVVDETSTNTLNVVEDWLLFNWLYVAAAVVIVIVMAMCIYICTMPCKRRKTREEMNLESLNKWS